MASSSSTKPTELEVEFAKKMIELETKWPGHKDDGEPEPTTADLDKGWDEIVELEDEYTAPIGPDHVEALGTAIGEGHADIARGGWAREDIRKKLQEMIDEWEWDE